MTNITHKVWKILDENPSIRKEMSRGLINNTALAKYIIKEKKVTASIDAVSSALRRYKLDRYGDLFKTASKIISHSSVSTKNKLANVAIIKDNETQELLAKLFTIVNYNKGEVLRIIQADESIKILVDEKNLSKIKELFSKNKIINIDEDLAEINMHLAPGAVDTPGILSVISNELTLNGINVMETMSCVPEVLWFVKEKDALKAYTIIYQLCQPIKKD
jgi:aspartokinase